MAPSSSWQGRSDLWHMLSADAEVRGNVCADGKLHQEPAPELRSLRQGNARPIDRVDVQHEGGVALDGTQTAAYELSLRLHRGRAASSGGSQILVQVTGAFLPSKAPPRIWHAWASRAVPGMLLRDSQAQAQARPLLAVGIELCCLACCCC